MYECLVFNKDLLYHTGTSARCYVAPWPGGEFGAEWTHVCVRLSPCAVPLKPRALQTCSTPIQNKKVKKIQRILGFTERFPQGRGKLSDW